MNCVANNDSLVAGRIPPKLTKPSSQGFAWPLAVLVIAAITGVVLFCFDPAKWQFPICFFNLVTGLHCPGCGATRALHQLVHGNVVSALHLNALLVVSLPLVAWLGIRFVVARYDQRPMTMPFSVNWLWTLVALAAVFSVVRNLPAFAWLAP